MRILRHPAAPPSGQLGALWKKGGGSQPAPPDPVATANAQAAASKEAAIETAKLNQFNQVSPFGSLTFTGGLGEPDRTATISLTDTGQDTFQSQENIARALSQFGENTLVPQSVASLTSPLDFSGAAQIPGGDDLIGGGNAIEQATFQRAAGLLSPEFARQRESLESDLLTRGLPGDSSQGVASEAFNNAISRLEENQGLALSDAALAAVQAGRQEQSRLVNTGLQLRGQDISEILTQRSQPLNELAALLQGAPAIQNPQFPAPGQVNVPPPDIQGLTQSGYLGQLNAANAANANRTSSMNGILGLAGALGGAAILASDRRLKRDIEQIGALGSGIPLYTFKYVWDDIKRVGVMAQDVLEVIPSAVVVMPSGFYAVKYGELR